MHTPGPWSMAGRPDVIKGADNTLVCSIETYGYHAPPIGRANARLIAAAPELLDALRQMVAEFGEYKLPVPACVTQARAAIAKATL